MYEALALRLGVEDVGRLYGHVRHGDISPSGQARAGEVVRPVLGGVFPGPWVSIMVMPVAQGQQIAAHTDQMAPQVARYHIPLLLNPGCWVFHGTGWQQLEEGQCYRMDPRVLHGAVNWGTTPRYHLIIDYEGVPQCPNGK